MVKFNHQNVMKLIGVCIEKGPSPYIVMPYMAYGSLLSYLKKHRAELTIANNENIELVRIYNHLLHLSLLLHSLSPFAGYCNSKEVTVYLSTNSQGNGVFSKSAVCSQRLGCSELYVSFSKITYNHALQISRSNYALYNCTYWYSGNVTIYIDL